MTEDDLREQFDDALMLAFSRVNGGCGCDYGSVVPVHTMALFELPRLGRTVTFEALADKGGKDVAGWILKVHMNEVHGD